MPDAEEREYLMNLPTSFVLPPEAVDRLRAAAGKSGARVPRLPGAVARHDIAPVETLPRPALEVR